MIKAFSLIELIVGITISMILMVSVGVFISSGMQNIFMQQKVLENTDNFTYFAGNLNTNFNLLQSGSFAPKTTGSGILFKKGQNFGEGGFTYIGTEILNGVYCEPDSEDTKTNSVYIKNFIPFEEQGEDIFDDAKGGFTGTLTSKKINVSGINYTSYQKEHVIKDDSDNIVVGKGIFGYKFTEGAAGTDIYLNSPTGLAQGGTNLFISDTLNNRILYLDNSNKIHLLLDESDGLNEPTGLYYTDDTLYIANSGNGEILKYSSKSNDKKLNINFKINQSINNLKKIEIEISPGITSITNPDNISDFTFNGVSKYGNDYLTGSTNRITYRFSNFFNQFTNSPNTVCSSNYVKYYEESSDIIKEQITNCNSSTGTLEKYKSSTFQNITSGDNITINTNSDIAGSDFSINGNYYTKLNIIGDTSYSDYFPYFTLSDNDLTTLDDNILTVERSGLKYPTGIWGTGNSNNKEFGDRIFTNLKLDYHSTDTLLGTPIKSLNITNSSNDLISLSLKYYKRYNCYNLDD
ncbi:MAG: hypothetical protein QM490_02140, partial [Candidatus Gracilibacteria bacterium]